MRSSYIYSPKKCHFQHIFILWLHPFCRYAFNKAIKKWLLLVVVLTLVIPFLTAQHLLAQGRAEVRAGHAREIREIAYAPDGKSFATASADQTIKIWDAARNSEIRTLIGHNGALFSIDYSSNGQYIATTANDHTAKIWDAKTGVLVRDIVGNQNEFTSARFMPDGKTLVTLGIGLVRLWSIPDGNLLRTFTIPKAVSLSLHVSPDGQKLAWGGRDRKGKGQVSVMDMSNGRITREFSTKTDFCFSIAFSPNNRFLAIPVKDEQVEVRDLTSGELVHKLKPSDKGLLVIQLKRTGGHQMVDFYSGVSFSPDGASLTAVGTYVRKWNIGSEKLFSEIFSEPPMRSFA